MSNEKILVVDDSEEIRALVHLKLTEEGFEVIRCADGTDAMAFATEEIPDLILLDLVLPGKGGFEICRELKADSRTSHIPVIMITAKEEEADMVAGLEMGADDYVTKPFKPRVLAARVRAVLRRGAPEGEEPSLDPVRIHGIEIHPGRYEVRVGGEEIRLTTTEFRILNLLARRPGWVYSREQIVEAVHGEAYVVGRAVDMQIAAIRKKLGETGDCIETVRGAGYRMRAE